MSEGWKGEITPLMQRISNIATGAGSLFVLAAGSRLALALPADPRAARIVADLYQPQRWKGRIFQILAKAAILIGIPKWRPTFRGSVTTSPLAHWLQESTAMGTVGFLGCNPNHGPRCILAGIDPTSGAKFIAKLGLDGSAIAVRREAEILERLNGRFPGVIRPINLEIADTCDPPSVHGIQTQEEPNPDLDWALLRLPHLGTSSPKSMADPQVRKLLRLWLGKGEMALGKVPWADQLFDRVAEAEAPTNWHHQIKSRQIRTALLHGDFAVWNLRNTEQGLIAIDWEWGQEDSVAGIDLAHGLRQECYMVRGMKPERAVAWMLEQAESPQWRDFLAKCGWADAHADWLRLGLLHSHFNALNPSAELLKVLGIHLKP